MGGSTVAQFLFDAYNTGVNQAVAQTVAKSLAAVAPWLHGAILLYVIILGYQMMFSALSWERGVTRVTRALIVCALMTAAYYDQFITQAATHTIPDAITNAVTGSTGLAGAQGWDALINATENYSAQVRAQAVGMLYISDRLTIWFAAGTARLILGICFFIWALAMATIGLLVAIGPYVLPFYLFDRTRAFAERWYGKIIALFLVLVVTLTVTQIVITEDARYMQQYAMTLQPAAPAQPETLFAGPDFIGTDPTLAGQLTQGTANVDAAIDTLWNVCLVFLFGMALMIIMTGIALYIGGASGFSAAPVFNAVTAVANVAARGRR